MDIYLEKKKIDEKIKIETKLTNNTLSVVISFQHFYS